MDGQCPTEACQEHLENPDRQRWMRLIEETHRKLFAEPVDDPDAPPSDVAADNGELVETPGVQRDREQGGKKLELKTRKVSSLFCRHLRREQVDDGVRRQMISYQHLRRYATGESAPGKRNRALLEALEAVIKHYDDIKLVIRGFLTSTLSLLGGPVLSDMFMAYLPPGLPREAFHSLQVLNPAKMTSADWDHAVRGVVVALTRAWLRSIDQGQRRQLTPLETLQAGTKAHPVDVSAFRAFQEDQLKALFHPVVMDLYLGLRKELAEQRVRGAQTDKEKASAEWVLRAVEQSFKEVNDGGAGYPAGIPRYAVADSGRGIEPGLHIGFNEDNKAVISFLPPWEPGLVTKADSGLHIDIRRLKTCIDDLQRFYSAVLATATKPEARRSSAKPSRKATSPRKRSRQ